MKSQGIGRPWLQLLRAVPGIQIDEIKADCCGMAGTYGFKKEKYDISMDIGRDLFRGILAYKPDLAVTECGSCQMQIEHGTHVRTLHPAEILYEAYRGSRSAFGNRAELSLLAAFRSRGPAADPLRESIATLPAGPRQSQPTMNPACTVARIHAT